jgi:aryl-alcohol dehydrogenase-like predicted oxidoreductase
MLHRNLGRTGVQVARLAFGTMSFGGDADEAESGRMYRRCREAGVNLFDTADVYNEGRAEEILGRLIAPERDAIVLCSKAYFPTGKDVNARGSSRFHLVRAVDASLRRLATDRIDVFYLHRFDDDTALDESLRALDDLVRAGKILYPAASNFAAWQVARALGRAELLRLAPIVALQPMYNLLKRQAEVEILPMCQAEGVACFPYSPLAGGYLTGKYGTGRTPTSGRILDRPMYVARYGDAAYLEAVDRFVALAGEVGVTPTALAIAWVGAHPGVTAPLLGARSVAQLEPALGALDVTIDAALYARVAALTPTPPPATDRSEEREQKSSPTYRVK